MGYSPWGCKKQDMTERLTLHHVDSIKLVESLLTSNAAAIASHFSRVQPCATPQTAANQAPPSPGFSRQERWSGLPFPGLLLLLLLLSRFSCV